jgi:hypothetical protein
MEKVGELRLGPQKINPRARAFVANGPNVAECGQCGQMWPNVANVANVANHGETRLARSSPSKDFETSNFRINIAA